MGGFNCAYIRVPKDAEPELFARKIAGLVQRPSTHIGQPWTVDYAYGYDWLYIEGIAIEGDCNDTRLHPCLALVEDESIVINTYEGVDAHSYRHCKSGECVRAIIVVEGKILQDHGAPEVWEKPIAEAWQGELTAEDWPRMFHTRYVVSAFHLPSPWESGPPECWDLEVEICS